MTIRDFALGAVGLTVLAACAAGSPEAGRPNSVPATSPPTVLASTPPSSAAPSTPPERPQGADGLTLAAAEMFIRHYIDVMNYAAKTGDTAALRDASESGCLGCAKYFNSVEKVNEQNGGLTGDYLERFVEVTALTRTKKDRLAASTNVTVGSYTARRSPSAKPVAINASVYTEQMVLSAKDGNWLMFEMELTER